MAPTIPTPTSSRKRPALRRKSSSSTSNPLHHPRKTHRPESAVTDTFSNSKRDKRLIRHSAFLSKIEDSALASSRAPSKSTNVTRTTTTSKSSDVRSALRSRAGGGISKPKRPSDKSKGLLLQQRRRRPSKKLVATLESLADALPELDQTRAASDLAQLREGKVLHRSLRTRPGALKRKERVVKGEVARFRVTMAQLLATRAGSGAGSAGGQDAVEVVENGAPMAEEQEEDGKHQSQTTTNGAAQSGLSGRWAALRSFVSSTLEQNPAFIGAAPSSFP